ncbi:2-hydroxyacid dehydrogenase [Bradyrhizobium sp. LHD-71]|uniref:2-hydroxyacid dehydrogenase n=1 Tax=Bradyrhizobium sp. LHD-71 TaxID=3072141 RepID=UPI00280DFA05|nr:2-hydroxyacid dehydrogenase [Bradyrhizobium sp. LHD-71]MDQ8729241.1 2-hydroxyacid dehydrogenase [Bradyrhizobium sp. LHD-71]
MRVAVFSTTPDDQLYLTEAAERAKQQLVFFDTKLDATSAPLAEGAKAVCVFVNDLLDAKCIEELAKIGIKLIALRCAGFNNVDLSTASSHGLTVARVPAYSPYAVAEHTVAMILCLNRKIHRAYNRTREGNFSLTGLLGFDLRGKTIGIVGTGEIGTRVATIARGFGCLVAAYDPSPNPACEALGVHYLPKQELVSQADILTLHCPLTPDTFHFIDRNAVDTMKHGAMLINTSRGAVADTRQIVRGLKNGQVGSFGMDVYEEEADVFFRDLSDKVIQDDVLARLMTFPNVLITGHQAFFTHEAMTEIARTTMASVEAFEKTGTVPTAVILTA